MIWSYASESDLGATIAKMPFHQTMRQDKFVRSILYIPCTSFSHKYSCPFFFLFSFSFPEAFQMLPGDYHLSRALHSIRSALIRLTPWQVYKYICTYSGRNGSVCTILEILVTNVLIMDQYGSTSQSAYEEGTTVHCQFVYSAFQQMK